VPTAFRTPAAQAIIIKKQQKILDWHKLVCRIIIQSLKTTAISKALNQQLNIFIIAANKINKGQKKD